MPTSRMKTIRTGRGILQADFAKALGVTQAAVGFYESGERNPDKLMCKKIARILGAEISYLWPERFGVGAKIKKEDI